MKKLSIILCTIFTIAASTPALAQNYNFTTLNYPGASSTVAGGIDGNNIVGWYEDAIGVTHGFLYNGTSWTTLDYPGALSTAVLDIHGNNIVGEFEDATGNHGFLYDGSSWKSLNYSGAFDTYAMGIDGSNIVGEYEDTSDCAGFQYNYDTDTWTKISFPTLSSNDVAVWGIDGNNIVGEFEDTAFNEHGFFYDGTNAPIGFLYPGSPNTVFHAIDGDNIVGIWYIIDESDRNHGTLYNLSSKSWTTIDYPGALSTELFGIDGNNIVGYYFDGSTYHGFVATPVSFDSDNVNLYGNVTYTDSPVCAMVLANGQYQFTCSGDGSFNLDVPLDSNGQITVYSFVSGLAPYKQLIEPSAGQGMQIQMAAGGEGAGMNVSYTVGEAETNPSWVRLTGNITYDGSPVCAMALANGQYMFTCSGDGSFDLELPLDKNGDVTLYGFCSGLPPYKEVFSVN